MAESFLVYARLLPLWYGDLENLCDQSNTKPMQCLINSAYVCVCHLMTKTPVEIGAIDDYVKVFLSCCQEMASNKGDPWWWIKGNIVSLLNVSDQISKYGHLRFYWEGNRERFIQSINPLLQNMRRTDSYLLKKMMIGLVH